MESGFRKMEKESMSHKRPKSQEAVAIMQVKGGRASPSLAYKQVKIYTHTSVHSGFCLSK